MTGSAGAVLVVLLPFLALVVLLAGSTRFLGDLPSRRLDEWHRREREAAFTGAYWPGTILGLGGGLAIAWVVGADVGEGLRDGTIVAVAVLLALLPTLVVAWRLPDEIVEPAEVTNGR